MCQFVYLMGIALLTFFFLTQALFADLKAFVVTRCNICTPLVLLEAH
jgi:hypothetical protein